MSLWIIYISLTAALCAGAIVLHVAAYLDRSSQVVSSSQSLTDETCSVSQALCRAPWLDVVVAYFTILPYVVGFSWVGGLGFFVALAAQVTALVLWVTGHELANYKLWQGPKISRTLSRLVGNWQNHLALWATVPAISVFWMVRLYELSLYPILTHTVNFPKYKAQDWVNVSRHKFDGLVGYDLIWCLYCDWMTGVWSLGTEMLRNVESFWCPIQFYPEKKCENCKIDFPDIAEGWVTADASLESVTQTLQTQYSSREENAWYGKTTRQLPAVTSDVPK